jgi:hypothetical protein
MEQLCRTFIKLQGLLVCPHILDYKGTSSNLLIHLSLQTVLQTCQTKRGKSVTYPGQLEHGVLDIVPDHVVKTGFPEENDLVVKLILPSGIVEVGLHA